VEAGSTEEVVNSIGMALSSRERACRFMACLNPHSYAVARSDAGFQDALKSADWLVPDGAGVVLAGAVLSQKLYGRITGADVFTGIMDLLNESGGRVFFLGGTEHTLSMIRECVAADYPHLTIAGTYSPSYKPEYTSEEMDHMVELINESAADVLWVGMTAPKQEKWIYQLQGRLNVPFAGAIGAVFDFYTGQIKRSPAVFQMLGLEWLPRLIQEPKRLWRRMFVSAPIFLFDVFAARLNGQSK
jgi:N-acetylglucosaminyldiphosphoundecaprenol N-acetyl-beta-D-mannosaminyltransferase